MLKLLVFLFVNSFTCVCAYRPLVLIHGVNSAYSDLDELVGFVTADFPSLPIFNLDLFNDDFSIVSLHRQVPKFASLLKNVTDHYGNVTLLGYSQGGSIARAISETSDNHNIHTLISLSSPGELSHVKLS